MLSCTHGDTELRPWRRSGCAHSDAGAIRADAGEALALVDDALLDAGHHLLGVVAQKQANNLKTQLSGGAHTA